MKIIFGLVALIVLVAMLAPSKNDNKSAAVAPAVAAIEPKIESKPESKPAADSLPPAPGTIVTITEGTAGCENYDDLKKMQHLVAAKDQEAARVLVQQRKCVYFKIGAKVTVEQLGYFSETACVRPKGQVNCVWAFRAYLKK
jgi:hypothetical protein